MLLMLSLIFCGCGGPKYMVASGACPPILSLKSEKDKSLLIITRSGKDVNSMSLEHKFDIENYLDET